ncbi:MAG: FecR family protein [Acidobacteriia bacterium]|nr:FecR family protein [Terriglobia bacterium]
MSDDYLWDKSGEPDPEIQKLEHVMGRLRHNRPAPAFPEFVANRRPRLLQMRLLSGLAGVAAGVVIIIGLGFLFRTPESPAVPQTAWAVTREGVGTTSAGAGANNLGPGQVLETDSRSYASLRAEAVGQIDVEPNTRLRLLDRNARNARVHRLALERGTIHATIWAPAGEFVIDTPSAMAVDLGCSYTLQVDDSGNGLLRTTLGWVGFKLNGHEAFIPAGAACSTRPKTGPGTPYFEDAAASFRAAVAKLDLESAAPEERAAALRIVLTQSRQRDALTLWHLLSRVPEPERGPVYDRLAKLVPAPAGVTREGILHLDQSMLDLWWNELGWGDVGLWRHWERTWEKSK